MIQRLDAGFCVAMSVVLCVIGIVMAYIVISTEVNPVTNDAVATQSVEVVTINPGVYHFPESGFQQRLADWVNDHPDHEVVAMCPAKPSGYFVLTRVKPEFLNYVLPGSPQ